MQNIDLPSLSPTELVGRLITLSNQCGYLKGQGKRYWGAVGTLKASIAKVEAEVLHRLGCDQSPEVTNKRAFIWLAMCRHRAVCDECGLKPMRGRGLEYWTTDKRNPDPLLLIMAWQGASVEKLKAARDTCTVLCYKCAGKKGALLTKNRTPHLSSYGVSTP